jgi:hypothetical protein
LSSRLSVGLTGPAGKITCYQRSDWFNVCVGFSHWLASYGYWNWSTNGKRNVLKAELVLFNKGKADFKTCSLLSTTVSATSLVLLISYQGNQNTLKEFYHATE